MSSLSESEPLMQNPISLNNVQSILGGTKNGTNNTNITSWVTGHHIYKRVWTPVIGEDLVVRRNRENPVDNFAVGVYKNGTLVGHIPIDLRDRFVQHLRRGDIYAVVVGKRENKRKRGLEVPVVYTLKWLYVNYMYQYV